MALIKCPECQREISDRAHDCPVCGFPLDEYFEEQRELEEERIREEKEKERQKELKKKEKEYLEQNVFKVGDKTFSFNMNERISAVIGANFQLKKDSLHKIIQDMLLDFEGESPTDFDNNHFGSFANALIIALTNPLIDEAKYLCKKYCTDFEQDYFGKEIEFAYDADPLYRDLMNVHKKAYSTFDLNTTNAHVQYYEDYTNAGTPMQPISSVYADTLGGLVGKSISARLVNGAAASLTSGGVRRRENAAANAYEEAIFKEALICNATVYSVLDQYVDAMVDKYMCFTFAYLMEEGEIFQIEKYPKSIMDFEEYSIFLDDEMKTNAGKKEKFLTMIKNNPGDFFVYAEGLMRIAFTREELQEIIRLINFLDISEDIKRILVNSEHSNCKLFDGEIDNHLQMTSKFAKTYEGRVFNSIEEKELYVLEEVKYSKFLSEFLEWDAWFKNSEYLDKYTQLVAMDQPHFDEWKEDYQKAMAVGKLISNAVDNNKFTQKMAKSVKKLIGAPVMVSTYKVEQLIELKNKDFEEIKGLKDLFAEDELPVIKVKWKPSILLISTKSFYLISVENKEDIIKFGLDDIEYIKITQQGFTTSRFLGIGILKHGYKVVFSDYIPEKDFKYVTEFIYDLNTYVCNNPTIKNNLLVRALNDTPCHQLNKDYLVKQIKIISEVVCLIGTMKDYCKADRVMKWVHQIGATDEKWSYLKWFFERNNIGLEYVFICDGYRIVTDKAFYISNKYMFPSDARIEKYEFEKYDEILSVRTSGDSWSSVTALLLIQKDQMTSIWTGKENAAFHQAIDAMALVLCENKEKVKGLIDKDFLFCRDCKKVFGGNLENVKTCPVCKVKIKKSGLLNYSGYKYHIEKYKKISQTDIDTIKNKVMSNFDEIIAESKKIIEEKKKTDQVQEINENVETSIQSNETDEKRKCSNCGKMILKKAKFCNFCGKSELAVYKDCVSCGKQVVANAKFCNFCGYRFVD